MGDLIKLEWGNDENGKYDKYYYLILFLYGMNNCSK